ncbi:MAG: 2-dehydro-3-deoxy-6-phosphogalactonate aldolase, partial [Pseudomonadota bacterium]
MASDPQIAAWLDELPLVAILRGLRPEEAVEIGTALIDTGFRFLEVPLNSPEPLKSIAALAGAFEGRALIGAGTVLTPEDCGRVADCGGRLIVMPHGDQEVIRAGK